MIIYQADPDIEESQIPPQFQGDLWTADAKKLLGALNISDDGIVKRSSSGFITSFGLTTVKVSFGRIEEFDCFDDHCL